MKAGRVKDLARVERALFRVQVLLDRASVFFVLLVRFRPRSRADVESRAAELSELLERLHEKGVLELTDREGEDVPEAHLLVTGSSVNVAIVAETNSRKATILRYTDSPVAKAELAASLEVQRRLRTDDSLAGWRRYVPDTLAYGSVEQVAFVLEECLSPRAALSVLGDDDETSEVISNSISVISELHKLTTTRHRLNGAELSTTLQRPIEIVRSGTPPGIRRARHRALEDVYRLLMRAIAGQELDLALIHGDFHLGNVLLEPEGNDVAGIIDWGRCEQRGLRFLDVCTLLVLTQSNREGVELGPYILRLLRETRRRIVRPRDRDILRALDVHLRSEGVSLRDALLMTWLKHVANNLENEERSRLHFLWRMRNVDLIIYYVASLRDRAPRGDR